MVEIYRFMHQIQGSTPTLSRQKPRAKDRLAIEEFLNEFINVVNEGAHYKK